MISTSKKQRTTEPWVWANARRALYERCDAVQHRLSDCGERAWRRPASSAARPRFATGTAPKAGSAPVNNFMLIATRCAPALVTRRVVGAPRAPAPSPLRAAQGCSSANVQDMKSDAVPVTVVLGDHAHSTPSTTRAFPARRFRHGPIPAGCGCRAGRRRRRLQPGIRCSLTRCKWTCDHAELPPVRLLAEIAAFSMRESWIFGWWSAELAPIKTSRATCRRRALDRTGVPGWATSSAQGARPSPTLSTLVAPPASGRQAGTGEELTTAGARLRSPHGNQRCRGRQELLRRLRKPDTTVPLVKPRAADATEGCGPG